MLDHYTGSRIRVIRKSSIAHLFEWNRLSSLFLWYFEDFDLISVSIEHLLNLLSSNEKAPNQKGFDPNDSVLYF